jgi:alkaline phosphatase D
MNEQLHAETTASGAPLPLNMTRAQFSLLATVAVSGLALAFAVLQPSSPSSSPSDSTAPATTLSSSSYINKIAFGSCTSYSLEPLPIFDVIRTSSRPDMWIWAGDMVYLDDPISDCTDPDTTPFPSVYPYIDECHCENKDWLMIPPYSCSPADSYAAELKYTSFLQNSRYFDFQQDMCGNLPPEERFPAGEACERPIIGAYDDHDFGTNNGNAREPDKHIFKNMYLDAVGVSPTSPRRDHFKGAFAKYSYRSNHAGDSKLVEVFLLDERYDRATLPCEVRREWCTDVVLPDPDHNKWGWCNDYLTNGNCCSVDESIKAFCADAVANGQDELFAQACDVKNEKFGTEPLLVVDGHLTNRDISHEDMLWNSGFCDMLGRAQRDWLKEELLGSTADVKLVVSGSVLLSQPTWAGDEGVCSGDDWDCFPVSRNWLINLLMDAGATSADGKSGMGCSYPIVLTGDYHFSDIKVIKGGASSSYGSAYGIEGRSGDDFLIQVMSSGMSHTTAVPHTNCHTYLIDYAGMRTEASLSDCGIVAGPNFGEVVFEWEKGLMHLRILGGDDEREDEAGEPLMYVTLDMKNRCEIVDSMDTNKPSLKNI